MTRLKQVDLLPDIPMPANGHHSCIFMVSLKNLTFRSEINKEASANSESLFI